MTLRDGVEWWHWLVALAFLLVASYAAVIMVWGLTVKPIRFTGHWLTGGCWPVRTSLTGGFRCTCGRASMALDDFPGHQHLRGSVSRGTRRQGGGR